MYQKNPTPDFENPWLKDGGLKDLWFQAFGVQGVLSTVPQNISPIHSASQESECVLGIWGECKQGSKTRAMGQCTF